MQQWSPATEQQREGDTQPGLVMHHGCTLAQVTILQTNGSAHNFESTMNSKIQRR
jgi:hypothetical protein